MLPPSSLGLDRRQDRRLVVQARVRVLPRDGSVGSMGRLVDVSAGGLRARAEHWGGVRPGEPVDVEITVQDSLESTPPPLVQLRGAALVVRLDEVPGQDACAALRFVGPLTLREPFAQMLLF